MCLKVIETCPGCEAKTGHVETIHSTQSCATSCDEVKVFERMMTRDHLCDKFACSTDGCRFSQKEMDAVEEQYLALDGNPPGEPTLQICSHDAAKKVFERLAGMYGRLTEDTDTLPRLPNTKAPVSTMGSESTPDMEAGSSTGGSGSARPSSTLNKYGNMKRVTYGQPSRNGRFKTQYRSTGHVHTAGLSPAMVEEIQKEKAEMDRLIQAQMDTASAGGKSEAKVNPTGAKVNPPEWLPVEDKFLQSLRIKGFSFRQIAQEFMTRRSPAALTVRRNNHRKRPFRDFVYQEESQAAAREEENAEVKTEEVEEETAEPKPKEVEDVEMTSESLQE